MPRTPASAGARHPALTWTLRVLRAAQLALLLCFVAYFVSVQVNAVAYLAGKNDPVIRGADPPVHLGSVTAAVADVIAGLVFEAIAVVIVFIVVSLFRGGIRKR
jgi:hypothetical protein